MHSEDGGRGVAGVVDFGPEDVVLVAPSDPPEPLVQNVLQSSHYGGKVRYFKGSIMSTRDLHMMQLRSASAVFLLSDLHSPDPKAEDARTVVSALILRDFDSEAKIFAEVHGKEAASHLTALVRPNAVVCIDELRAHLMASTVNLPGLSTLFDNLCCAFARPDPDPRRPTWLSEYFEGADKELYRIRCPKALSGLNFVDAAVQVFDASTWAEDTLYQQRVEGAEKRIRRARVRIRRVGRAGIR